MTRRYEATYEIGSCVGPARRVKPAFLAVLAMTVIFWAVVAWPLLR